MNLDISKRDDVEALPEEDWLQVGQWYWHEYKEGEMHLVCAMFIGSNYVRVESPEGHGLRVHINEVHASLTPALDWLDHIKNKQAYFQDECKNLLLEMGAIARRFGLNLNNSLLHESESKELTTLSNTEHIGEYQNQLIEAKEKTIPELQEKFKSASEKLTDWMKADSFPLEAARRGLDEALKSIDDRIHKVSIYSGVNEHVAHILKGERAHRCEKIHIFQRVHYMDEECLASYEAGGITCEEIEQFDKWVAKEENFKRLLPKEKCLVAFRVRRNEKDRGEAMNITQAYIQLYLAKWDKLTFLYVRNGDNLFRLSTEISFEKGLFHNQKLFANDEPLMFGMFCRKFQEFIKQSELENHHHKNFYDWYEFNPETVWYDDAVKGMKKELNQFNDVALVIQGVLDRSDVLQPHPKINIRKTESFNDHIVLVDDGFDVLDVGDMPDIEAYLQHCNRNLATGSICVGQRALWVAYMKEKDRRANGYKHRYDYCGQTPWYDPGPGRFARVEKYMPRLEKVKFRWAREKATGWGEAYSTFTCVQDLVLDVNGYTPGDYKIFFADHRTRRNYLRWAPLLLAAEDYHGQKGAESA